MNNLPYNIEGIFQTTVAENPNATPAELGMAFHENVLNERNRPRVLTYVDALIALQEGKTLLCTPPNGSSFLANSYRQLTQFSRSVDRNILKSYTYSLV